MQPSQDSWSLPGMTVWKPTAKYYLSVLFNKRNRSLCHRRCNTLKWQTNVKLDWTDVCLFYVLFCSYVLLSKQGMHPQKQHSASDTSSLAVTRDLISIIAQCQREHLQTIIIRFLVLARNDGMRAIVVTLQKTFVHINKRSRRLLASKMQNIERTNECQARLNWRLNFLCFSFVLMFFCLNNVYTHERKTLCPRLVIPGCDQGPYLNE